MQTILFTNNNTNLSQEVTTNGLENTLINNEQKNVVSFLEYIEEISNHSIDGIETLDILSNEFELQEYEVDREITEIINEEIEEEEEITNDNIKQGTSEKTINSIKEVNAINLESNTQIYNSLNSNTQIYNSLNSNSKNDEIGEKKIDSVKCSLGNNLSASIDDLLKRGIADFSKTNQKTLNDREFTEEFISEDLSGDIDFLETNLDFKKINSNDQADNGMQSKDIEANQKEIFKQIKEGVRGNSATRSMQIMLKPHHLGKVNLNLKFFNNAMHINVFVENENVENLLRQNLEHLINSVNPAGTINIGSITISKIEDLLEKNLKENSDHSDRYKKNKGNPFVHKISKAKYYTQKG